MGRRANGEGTIYYDTERGTWVGQWTAPDGRRRKVRAATKTDVAAKLAGLRRDADRPATDGNATVGQLLVLWRDRDVANRDLAPRTAELYRWAVALLDDELGAVRLRALTVARVEQALDRIATGGPRVAVRSQRTMTLVRNSLAAAVELGQRRGLIAHNPARLAELHPDVPRATPRRALDAVDAVRLWEAVEGSAIEPLVRVMLTTGLRPGEALALAWDAVDLDAGVLHVRRGVQGHRGRTVVVDRVKSAASRRTIDLPAPAVAVLRAQRAAVARMVLAAATWAPPVLEGRELALVFPTRTGRPRTLSELRRSLIEVCERAGLPVVRPHELRHSCASILVDQGVPIELVADLLGHRDASVTARVYRHRLRASADAAVGPMGALFGSGRISKTATE